MPTPNVPNGGRKPKLENLERRGDSLYNKKTGRKVQETLDLFARENGMMPTPTADDAGGRRKKFSQGGTSLSAFSQSLPTAKARDYKGARKVPRENFSPNLNDKAFEIESQGNTGYEGMLNPDFVEWFMGWPVGWTDPLCENPVQLDISVWPDIPMTTTRKDWRIDRIRALGNGQVPQCAAAAFQILMERIENSKSNS